MNDLQFLFSKLQGMTLLVFGQHRLAKIVFERMVRSRPDNAYVLASLAQLEFKNGNAAGAIALMQRLVQVAPSKAAWYNLGFALAENGSASEAETAFRQSIALDEKMDMAWYGLSLLLIKQNRLDEAIAALQRNTALQPMSPYGWYQLARVHVDRKEPQEALKVIKHLRGFEPKIADQLVRETGLVA
jgi:predicted Zn-dependent protease